MKTALIIGGGPAGLMAADVMSSAGLTVIVADQMPSVGRKFLMAGKSGLNITKNEPLIDFCNRYFDTSPVLMQALSEFGPTEAMEWMKGLDQNVFTGSTGRVFPNAMKASPTLRAWLKRLSDARVDIRTRWIWQGWEGGAALFETPTGQHSVLADCTILALGGGSWARLGSDGAWDRHLQNVIPFKASNCGFQREWSDHMARYLGHPIKGVALAAGDCTSRGEFILTSKGFEGGGIYEVSQAMQAGAALTVDLVPDITRNLLQEKWSNRRRKATLSNFLKSTLGFPPVKVALFHEIAKNIQPTGDIPSLLKSLPLKHSGPNLLDDAISTSGGVSWDALNEGLMLRQNPGIFCAGEMIAWDAPTGGYLLTACLATGRHAAFGALKWLGEGDSP